jgi:hypothetical protein
MVENEADIKKSLQVLNWLYDIGALKSGPIKARAVHGMRTKNFSSLHNYLKGHPKIIRQGKLIHHLKKVVDKLYPFSIPSMDAFSGNLPMGYCYTPFGPRPLFSTHDSELHLHEILMGKTGSGKTNVAKIQLASIRKHSNACTWVFAVDDEYREMKGFFNDYKIINIFKLYKDNPFVPPHHKFPHLAWLLIISEIICVENNLKQSSKNILFDILNWLFKKRGIYNGSNNYPTCQDVLNVLKNRKKIAKTYQEKASYEALINRFNSFVHVGDTFTTKESLDIERLQDSNIIFEFNDLTSYELYNTIISIMLYKVFCYRRFKGTKGNFNPLVCLVEEARKAFDFRREANTDRYEPTLNIIMSQSRKYRLGIFLLTQEPYSISRTPKANVNMMVALPLIEGEELTAIQRSMRLNDEQMDYYVSMPAGRAIVKYGKMLPFVVDFPLFEIPMVQFEESILEKDAEEFLKELVVHYGREACGTSEDQVLHIPKNCQEILEKVAQNRFKKSYDIRVMTGLSPTEFKDSIVWLLENEFMIEHKIRISKGPKSRLFELTQKAYDTLRDWKVKFDMPRGKGSFRSKVYSSIVKDSSEKNGRIAEIEELIPGTNKQADVLTNKAGTDYVAYEITLSQSNVLENILKDLKSDKVNKVVLVFENMTDLKSVRSSVRESDVGIPQDRVGYQTISQFF